MTVVHSHRQASGDELAREMDRRGAAIEKLEAERNLYKGKYRSMAALMENARSEIRQISEQTEDEGDRAYFGSTNHADRLQDLAEDMEGWCIDFDLPKGDINKMESDPYAEIRQQRSRAEDAEAALTSKCARVEHLEERLQAIIDWADLATKNAAEFDSHGVRNLDGPVFDAAREALKGSSL